MRKLMLASTSMALVAAFANKGDKAAADAATDAPAATRVAPEVTGVFSVTLPERKSASRGTTSAYPFASLTEAGQLFGVKNKDKRAMSSIVSNQNKKYRAQRKDTAGNLSFKTKTLTAADGSVTEVMDTKRPIWDYTRKFETVEVTPEIAESIKDVPDLAGSKVLVRRIV